MSWSWYQAWVTHRRSWSPSSSTPSSASWGARERSRLAARVLFFDLDGTLTDSRLGITRCMKHALEQRRIVEHFGLAGHFTRVYGSQPDGRFDDKAKLIAPVLESEKIDPDAAVMIGDRAVDIRGARANSIRSIGVLWGYGSEQELIEAGADRVCVAPAELATCW